MFWFCVVTNIDTKCDPHFQLFTILLKVFILKWFVIYLRFSFNVQKHFVIFTSVVHAHKTIVSHQNQKAFHHLRNGIEVVRVDFHIYLFFVKNYLHADKCVNTELRASVLTQNSIFQESKKLLFFHNCN